MRVRSTCAILCKAEGKKKCSHFTQLIKHSQTENNSVQDFIPNIPDACTVGKVGLA